MSIDERKSQLIQELENMRKDSIWIPEGTRGTINPACRNNKPAPGLIEIWGNSNGPIDVDAYFNSDIRILYLLKEPFIEGPSFQKGDRGGHDQSAEYADASFETLENETYRNLIRNVYSAVNLRQFSDSDKDMVKAAEKIFRESLCVLNCNYFPGIIKNSSAQNLIEKWSSNNQSLITKLISLYKPNIIIGGNTLQVFYHAEAPDGSSGKIFGQNAFVLSHQDIEKMTHKQWSKDFFWNSNMICLNLPHPSAKYKRTKYSNYMAYWESVRQIMIDVIAWWYKETNKVLPD